MIFWWGARCQECSERSRRARPQQRQPTADESELFLLIVAGHWCRIRWRLEQPCTRGSSSQLEAANGSQRQLGHPGGQHRQPPVPCHREGDHGNLCRLRRCGDACAVESHAQHMLTKHGPWNYDALCVEFRLLA